MPRLYLVRHGHAAASFVEASDPGLDQLGESQALTTAMRLVTRAPLPLITSPLKRARETAHPLEKMWERHARIEPAIAEIPSPGVAFADRGPWLRAIMTSTWSRAPELQQQWAKAVVAALLREVRDVIAFSHFVAINVTVAHALSRDDVTVFHPANASITILEHDGSCLRLVERGEEADTTAG